MPRHKRGTIYPIFSPKSNSKSKTRRILSIINKGDADTIRSFAKKLNDCGIQLMWRFMPLPARKCTVCGKKYDPDTINRVTCGASECQSQRKNRQGG